MKLFVFLLVNGGCFALLRAFSDISPREIFDAWWWSSLGAAAYDLHRKLNP